MAIELMPEPTNVVRFPVEKCVAPSMDLIRSMEPDVESVIDAAESFFLTSVDRTVRDRVLIDAATNISQQCYYFSPEQRAQKLDELLKPFITAAIDACRAVEWMSQRAAHAHQALIDAQTESGRNVAILERVAGDLLEDAARLLIIAHYRCEEAHGVSMAVETARRTDLWSPEKMTEATEWLIAAGQADAKRRAASPDKPH